MTRLDELSGWMDESKETERERENREYERMMIEDSSDLKVDLLFLKKKSIDV